MPLSRLAAKMLHQNCAKLFLIDTRIKEPSAKKFQRDKDKIIASIPGRCLIDCAGKTAKNAASNLDDTRYTIAFSKNSKIFMYIYTNILLNIALFDMNIVSAYNICKSRRRNYAKKNYR